MPLQPDSSPGLWVNSDYATGGPGVFALIIGISRYDHLTNGVAPAAETYGLGQLAVSALTAYRLFVWLRGTYKLNGWPVARVRLLLSAQKAGVGKATADELTDCDPAICAHAPEATFTNCRQAIENWYAEMQSLPAMGAGKSLFFFSGHGMELRLSQQVLLPGDYLRPPTEPLNEAISTANLMNCLPFLSGVSSHVLLLDACRNDLDKLRGRRVTGADILNDNPPGASNPLFEKGVLSATASGLQAYQPKAGGGLSLFGQALLDGLTGTPNPALDEAPLELRLRDRVSTVEINKLGSYMKGRVAALIKAARESVVQIVRADVSTPDPGAPIDLTEVEGAGALMVEEIILDTDSGLVGAGAAPTVESGAWFERRYSEPVKPRPAPPAGAPRVQHYTGLHDDVFHSEDITDPWLDSLRLTGLATRTTLNQSAVEIISAAHGEQTYELHQVQVHFRIVGQDPVGHLVSIRDVTGRRFCCVVPTDRDGQAIFQLEIDVEKRAFIRFAAYLSEQDSFSSARMKSARAWNSLRALDATDATGSLQSDGLTNELEGAFREGEDALRSKFDSPLAATVAAVLLLKGNRLDLMHDWTRNLANRFPRIPDGVALWAEQHRRGSAGRTLEPDLARWFVQELSRRALPFTAYGFDRAAEILRDIVRGRIAVDDRTSEAATRQATRFGRAEVWFRDDGLFSAYAGWPDDWSPIDLIGLPEA